jgi:hypothetical protein
MPFRRIVLQNKFVTARRTASSNLTSKDARSLQQQLPQNSARNSKNGSVRGSVRKGDAPSGRSDRSELCASSVNSVFEAAEPQDATASTAAAAATGSSASLSTTTTAATAPLLTAAKSDQQSP